MQGKIGILIFGTVLVALAPQAMAQDFSAGALNKAFPYKDLPGVRQDPGPDGTVDAPNCTQEVRLQNGMRRNADGERAPTIIYRCEKDGLVIESPRPPVRKYWNPLDAR